MSKITCPTCGFDAICVVEATLAETGEQLSFPVGAVALEAEGFCFSLPDPEQDGSTTDEMAECYVCGRRGPLADFGFGAEAIAEAVVWPCAEQAQEGTLRLTLTVTYQTGGASQRDLAEMLEAVALAAVEKGLLTDDTAAEVLTWKADGAEVYTGESFA